MSQTTMNIAEMVELLPESEKRLVYELVSHLLPDNIATSADLAAHNAAMEEFRRGEMISHEDIDWD